MQQNNLLQLAKLLRYFILLGTTKAASGHPTSSLSAVELMTVLFFDGFLRYDLKNPEYANNDRLIFSKGHASPLFYALYAAAGEVTEAEIATLRKFGSRLEGHPTLKFPFTEVPTGSLGQGLSVGVGMAINAKYVEKLPYNTYVLLGDSEMAEGSNYEALQLAKFYKLNNLIAILDVNRLGQSRETLLGHDIKAYAKRIEGFGWNVITVDGHSLPQIKKAFEQATTEKDGPTMIIAKTFKGRGISLLEDKENWHGKPLSEEQFQQAVTELGTIDKKLRGKIAKPLKKEQPTTKGKKIAESTYKLGDKLATRKAYGNALVRIFPKYPDIVVLDAETSNSTFAETFKKEYPDRYFEMFIAEQNMVGVAGGLARRGKKPLVSTFAAFFSRAFDQIRMSQYANANITFVGSHAGVSIGEDGASQMGLEDIAMFRSLRESVVFYPSDAVSTEKLTELAVAHQGIEYIRTTRSDTQVLYANDETFEIGGSKTLKSSTKDVATVIGAGITLYESLKAYEELKKDGIAIRVIDLYSIKPVDVKTLEKAAKETKALLVVEDHYEFGGIGEAVKVALSGKTTPIISLSVKKLPESGKPDELLAYEEINAAAIIKKIKSIVK